MVSLGDNWYMGMGGGGGKRDSLARGVGVWKSSERVGHEGVRV